MSVRLHANEVLIAPASARALIKAQFPLWADWPIRSIRSYGTDHQLFRLGDRLVLRFPRLESAVEQQRKEHLWLPRLAPLLPVAIPEPIAEGRAGQGFPWPWSVYRWLSGTNLPFARVRWGADCAVQLAQVLRILRMVEPGEELAAGAHNSGRGLPLLTRHARVLVSIESLGAEIDGEAALKLWLKALDAPPHIGPPMLLHGDLSQGNLLFRRGKLAAILDFGCLGAGDPACDLALAWNFLDPAAREIFRRQMQVSDAEWERGRGWALSIALIALPYYRESNALQVEMSKRTIAAVVAD